MTDNVVGFFGGIVGFVAGEKAGLIKFSAGLHDVCMFIIITIAAGLLGYVGKVLGSVLIKWIKRLFSRENKK